jgi:hypothetical protein
MIVENSYRNLGTFDTGAFAAGLDKLGDGPWNADTARQKVFAVHKDTQTIIIQDFPLDWDGAGFPATLTNSKVVSLYPLLLPLISNLELKLNGKAARVLLVKLASNSSVYPHVDGGYYLNSAHRVHIPVKTNKDVLFTVNNVQRHLAINECIEISNSHEHSVVNNSSEERVHIICDIVPNHLISK